MTDEERRQAVMQLRELRTSPQALGRTLRKRSSDEDMTDGETEQTTQSLNETGISLDSGKSGKPRKKPAAKTTSAADLYKELGL